MELLYCYCSRCTEFEVFLRAFQRKNPSLTVKIPIASAIWNGIFASYSSSPQEGMNCNVVFKTRAGFVYFTVKK